MIKFRNWVHNLWLENCEERLIYRDGVRLSEQEYFQRFKWWLRREYKHNRQLEIEKQEKNKKFKVWNTV